TVLITTATWLCEGLHCTQMTTQRRDELYKLQALKSIRLVKKYKDKSGQQRVAGTRQLKYSQVYPWGFAFTVAGLHNKFLHQQQLMYPSKVMDDRNLKFMDVDPNSSDSDLEDVVAHSSI
ncbi:unnamed protein product, partial [Durusdinium trenchii]